MGSFKFLKVKTRSKATISTLLAFVLVFSLLALIDHQNHGGDQYYDDYKTNHNPLEGYEKKNGIPLIIEPPPSFYKI
jgi:hypothetical protein